MRGYFSKYKKNNFLDTHIQAQTIDKLYNSLVRINFTENGYKFKETGFLIKFKIKNNFKYFLMTYYHIFNEKYVNKKMVITLYYGKLNEEKKLEIILDRNERNIKYFDNPFDVTLIEIIEKDNIKKDNFLEPDLNYKNGYLYYNNKSYYIVSYNHNNINEKEIKVSSGKITKILNEPEFEYSSDIDCRNLGSSIILSVNLLVVGIHKQRNITKSINYGTFFGYIIDNIEKDELNYKKIKLIKEEKNKEEIINEKYSRKKIEDKYYNNEDLLKNIKSKYVMIIVLSNLNEKIKLDIVKYNKRIQNIININLSNYMFFSGRYIEYETKKKGKEYNGYNNYLIYEGGICKGKRNGKGKEYNKYCELIYEGEYLNGKRNGKGKEYYSNGKLLFEGEYLNGNRSKGKEYDIKGNISYDLNNLNGLIKKYYYNGKIEFEGEYLNGKKKGKGKEYNDDGHLIFEGEYLNGERNGKGKEYYDFELIYEGEYLNGKRHGKGKEYDNRKLIFEGEYLNGNRWKGKGYKREKNISYILENGKGYIKEYDSYHKLTMEGEYLDGKRNGKWKKYDSDNNIIFEGEYVNGKMNGEIKIFYNGGQLELEGEYLNDEKNGFIKEYYYETGKLKFEGLYLNGKKNGKGKKYNYKGELEFDGEYLNDNKLKGKGYINNKIEYEGEYLFNKKWNGKGYDNKGKIIYTLNKGNGKVKEYHDGVLNFDGEYLNGKRNGKGKQYFWNKKIEFDGEYLNGKKKKGKEYDHDGHLIFEGEYFNGEKWNGKEKKYHFDDKIIYEGEYLNGKIYGKEYHCISGKVEFEGEFLNGKKWNGKLTLYEQPLGIKIFCTGKYVNGIQVLDRKFNK